MGELLREPVAFKDAWALEIGKLKDASRDMAVFDFPKLKGTLRYDPRGIKDLTDMQQEVSKLMGVKAHILADYPGRKIVTFGSCFANNIVAYLVAKGANAKTTMLTEDINCTYNNSLFLRKVFLGESSPLTDELKVNYKGIASDLKDATDVILTLGNIFRLQHKGGPLVQETPEETVELLRDVVSLVKTNTRARLFITVSPIPISGYRGSDYATAIEADCSSKCQLRTALRSVDGFTYLPIFEIFRWLAPHTAFAAFGGDDGHQRHITRSQLEVVMEALC